MFSCIKVGKRISWLNFIEILNLNFEIKIKAHKNIKKVKNYKPFLIR